jgi:NAD(P)-dependent dehydrogenase (short-subunit alcohol dehydrogenase family)
MSQASTDGTSDHASTTSPESRFSLEGKVALVTGGTRGLGRSMVAAFAEAGADVVVSSRKLAACQAVADEIEQRTGRRALAHACHVAHWDEIEPLVDAAYDRFGKLDVLVNNAGMSPVYDRLSDVTEELWDKVFGVNLKGPFRLTALVGERMVAAGSGSVIMVSSTGSIRPNGTILPYAAAKAGLNAMAEGFAQALGPQVRVNTIMAGPFYTDASRDWAPDRSTPFRSGLERMGEPDEVVGAALYLASEASSYTTSATIRVDGGLP